MSRTKARVIALAALTPLLAVAACSSGSDGDSASSGGSQIDYWLWDALDVRGDHHTLVG